MMSIVRMVSKFCRVLNHGRGWGFVAFFLVAALLQVHAQTCSSTVSCKQGCCSKFGMLY
jgi:hypothetical protein